MFAIIETGGKQLRVEEGKTYFVEKLNANEGDEVSFDKVLLIDDKKVKTGTPYVKGAKVTAKVVKNGLAKKVQVFKYKAKANYRRLTGHRQPYTKVSIEKIEG